MKKALFIYIVLFPIFIQSQKELLIKIDTIKITHRSGGELDSMDMSFLNSISTFSGGNLNNLSFQNSNFTILNKSGMLNFRSLPEYKNFKFSAIPHLGFAYSFSAKNTQLVNLDYEQILSNNKILNFKYLRNSSNGFLRHGAFSDNYFQLQFLKTSRFYSYTLNASYSNKKTELNGGVLSYENIETQGLDFLPIANSTAKNNIKLSNVSQKNYFNLLKDSIKGLGFISKHQYDSESREFEEINSFSKWKIDSLTTRDQYRFASLQNGVGFYVKNKNLFTDLVLLHRYWDFQNLGIHHDTNEIKIASLLIFNYKKFNLKNDLTYNLIGAGGEWMNQSFVNYLSNKIQLQAGIKLEQKWPEALQRYYFSNTFAYITENYKLQNRITSTLNTSVQLNKNSSINFSYTNTSLRNNYFFIDSLWRNDTLNLISVNSFIFKVNYTLRSLTIQPKFIFNLSSSNFNYLPSNVISARILIKKKMFKAKKLEGIYGADFTWSSSYKLMNYNNYLDAFTLNNTDEYFNQMSNVSIFLGYSIGEFRFYFRYENLAYFWNDKKNQVISGFPIQKNLLKIGLTWDFFN